MRYKRPIYTQIIMYIVTNKLPDIAAMVRMKSAAKILLTVVSIMIMTYSTYMELNMTKVLNCFLPIVHRL